jgi:propionyl-CoA carboxylase alpha chain
MPNHERAVSHEWVVSLGGLTCRLLVEGERIAFDADAAGLPGPIAAEAVHWRPGERLARAHVDGADLTLKVEPRVEGFRIRYRGADLDVTLRRPRLAELARLMPEKLPPDTSRMLLCPMPGLVVRIDVAEGDEVFDGQSLAMIEAMKMENVLRAERKARVAKIHARPGDSLAVDAVILEFD